MARRARRSRNPFNQPKPAEWATMSKSLRKAWNRKHWRPHDYMVEVPLKRYATRKANQRDGGSGRGMLQLAAKIEKLRASNPGRDVERRYQEAVATVERQMSGITAQFRKADVLERKRLRDERRRVTREETVRPLRSNPTIVNYSGKKVRVSEEIALLRARHAIRSVGGERGKFKRAYSRLGKRLNELPDGRRPRSNPKRRRNPSDTQHLIEAIGDWLVAEDEQGAKRFYEDIDHKPRNRLLIKSVWTMAHRLGITTKPQLDRFKATHHRELARVMA